MKMRKNAFTLIELLIVVAIIAILAAIAVPNFLEAQVRSKVSRQKADMRSLATAIESYAVDWNEPPQTIAFNPPSSFGFDLLAHRRLSTPVAYISDAFLPEIFNGRQGWLMYDCWDPVQDGAPPADVRYTCETTYTYICFPGDDIFSQFRFVLEIFIQGLPNLPPELSTPQSIVSAIDEFARGRWFIVSPGPDTFYRFDQLLEGGLDDTTAIVGQIGSATLPSFQGIYDPSNGTVSVGEIARSRQGFVNDVK